MFASAACLPQLKRHNKISMVRHRMTQICQMVHNPFDGLRGHSAFDTNPPYCPPLALDQAPNTITTGLKWYFYILFPALFSDMVIA